MDLTPAMIQAGAAELKRPGAAPAVVERVWWAMMDARRGRGRPIRDIEVFNAAVAAYRIGGSISSVSRKFKLSQSLRKLMKEMGRDENGKEDC